MACPLLRMGGHENPALGRWLRDEEGKSGEGQWCIARMDVSMPMLEANDKGVEGSGVGRICHSSADLRIRGAL